MKDTRNDLQLCTQVSRILGKHNELNRCLRDNNLTEMWKILGDIQNAAELASFRIMDLRGGV